ncbi:MAG: 50S ribosomal protein L22 [Nanoarchaeota archaeon]|nr:50S ribosomal protein L22 [Nanoarchaeota archaeon]
MATTKNTIGTEHRASAKMTNLPISTKQSIEISRYLRYKNTTFAKKFLGEVALLRKAVPFTRFTQDMGHKAGMAAGRYPQKAAREFLRLIKSVEANAHAKGLNTTNLKIVKLLANKASIPLTGGRIRHGTKRTHLEVMVMEALTEQNSAKSTASKKARKKTLPAADKKQNEAQS